MGRLVVIGIIVVLVVWLLRRALAGPRAAKKTEPESETKGDLVNCAHCGVNLPKAEARGEGARFYCSEEHWRLGPKDG